MSQSRGNAPFRLERQSDGSMKIVKISKESFQRLVFLRGIEALALIVTASQHFRYGEITRTRGAIRQMWGAPPFFDFFSLRGIQCRRISRICPIFHTRCKRHRDGEIRREQKAIIIIRESGSGSCANSARGTESLELSLPDIFCQGDRFGCVSIHVNQ